MYFIDREVFIPNENSLKFVHGGQLTKVSLDYLVEPRVSVIRNFQERVASIGIIMWLPWN